MNIEDRLHTDMDRFTRDVYVPEGLALKAYRHSQKRRATVRVGAGAATALAVGAVAAAGAAGAFGSAPAHKLTGPTAYLLSRVESALAPARISNLVGHTRMVFPPGTAIEPVPGGMTGSQGSRAAMAQWGVGYTVGWAYGRSSKLAAYSASGQPVFDLATRVANGTATSTAVIYGSRTWWTGSSALRASGQSGCDEGDNVRLSGGTVNAWPDFIRSQLACGAYTVAGHQMVGGIDTLKLAGASNFFTLWVNPSTYLPVQMTGGSLHLYFQWLPATSANLAQLKEPVPAGFQQISAPARP